MKITLDAATLQRWLPVLALCSTRQEDRWALLELDHRGLTLSCNNAVFTASQTLSQAASGEPLALCVDGSKLKTLVRSCDRTATVTLTVKDDHVGFSVGRSRNRLSRVAANHFAKRPSPDPDAIPITLTLRQISEWMAHASYAVAGETDARAHLHFLSLRSDGTSLYCAATDGHRAAQYRRTHETPLPPFEAMIPKGFPALVGTLDGEPLDTEVKMLLSERQLDLRMQDITITSSLGGARFPADRVNRFFDGPWVSQCHVDSGQLAKAVSRISNLMKDMKVPRLTLSLDEDSLVIRGLGQGQDEFVDELDLSWAGPVTKRDYVVFPPYLQDEINHNSQEGRHWFGLGEEGTFVLRFGQESLINDMVSLVMTIK